MKPGLVEVSCIYQVSKIYQGSSLFLRSLMSVQRFSPEGLLQPTPYHHVAVGTGTRHVHVAGQISRLADATPVAPGDLAGQVAQALRNTASALAGAEAS